MAAEDYGFKPLPELRTFGETLAHVADVQMGLCAAAKGERKGVNAASKTTKADLSKPEDQMFVVNFNERVSFGLPKQTAFTESPTDLELAISQIPATGQTALYDGITEALNHLNTGGQDKKVLIVISDGSDNASKHTLAQVLKLATQSSAIIYTIGIYDDDAPDRNPKVLRTLANATGGISFFSGDAREPTAATARGAHDIRSQYTIGYVPSKPAQPGDYRTVRVVAKSAHQGKLTVRIRCGRRPAMKSSVA